MPHVYAEVDKLDNTDKVGSHQCVALVQRYAQLPATSFWREGAVVVDSPTLATGTAIATFVDGRYGSLPSGNHAAFFVSHATGGIWVMDQWANDQTKPKVSKRFLRRKGKTQSGAFVDPSNNADAYGVIE
jgi:hypothetical protein